MTNGCATNLKRVLEGDNDKSGVASTGRIPEGGYRTGSDAQIRNSRSRAGLAPVGEIDEGEVRMPNSVSVPVSIGELYDKISILKIKSERIHDKNKLENIELELGLLTDVVKALPGSDDIIYQLNDQLKEVNQTLWDCEEAIRDCERKGAYGEEFVATARAIHRNNDRRAEIKRQINLRSGSSLVEEKSYQLPDLGSADR